MSVFASKMNVVWPILPNISVQASLTASRERGQLDQVDNR